MRGRRDDRRWNRRSPTLTFRKTIAALCRLIADALDPPRRLPPAPLPVLTPALFAATEERALTRAEIDWSIVHLHLRRALRPTEKFEA